ncbi:YfgM family protein [Frigoriflavimonas asaccharolytica]|uniref:Putative negative regulator of RcsB-dependent stress response n=1 Tax=Frigoriflavimonas asaccharolytica TaxID=2735899 RepID=A0A8J8K7K1_9FLAO|nr:tetratricopeptide repeat protein [Frigoriflavimonas asaccharolytica]NRS91037.1 putative negative regulator of RcsB-dependent stress response [Frigoriflavimonas asaccharolytica]
MSKKNKEIEGKETVEFFQELDKDALKTEKFVERNAKLLGIIFGALVLGVLGYFVYQQYVVAPKNEEAMKSYFSAQKNLTAGKDTLALGGKSAANPGFLGTYEKYSGTNVGKLSAYNAGLLKFKEGKFQESYDLLDKFSSGNGILMALKYGAMADAQSNLNKSEEAMSLIDKAVSASDDMYTQYYFSRKGGILALALNKKDVAKKYFSSIGEKYQEYDNGTSDAYVEMVKYY